jgi:hypothetical protein
MARMYEVVRSDEEIDDLFSDIQKVVAEKGTKFRGMTYEDGLKDGINWITNEVEDYPYGD